MSKQSAENAPKTNITCDQVEAQLVQFVHGALAKNVQQQIAAHLDSCNPCALSLRELRTLESELRGEATRFHPSLSDAASQRIQQQVYRRMRLSLVWQRFFQAVKMGGAVVGTTAVLLIALLFGYQWLQFMAGSDDREPVQGASAPLPVQPAAATPADMTPTLEPVRNDPTAVSPTHLPPFAASNEFVAWKDMVSITPGDSPPEIAYAIIESALAKDSHRLTALFTAMPIYRDPTIRLWLLFNRRCHGTLTADDFTYEQLPTGDLPVTAVYLTHQNRYTGEIKFRNINGEWYAVFTQAPSINACLQERLIMPNS